MNKRPNQKVEIYIYVYGASKYIFRFHDGKNKFTMIHLKINYNQ